MNSGYAWQWAYRGLGDFYFLLCLSVFTPPFTVNKIFDMWKCLHAHRSLGQETVITYEEETSWLGVRGRKIYFSSYVLPFVSSEFLLSTHMTHSRTFIFLGLVHQTFNSIQLLTQSHGGDRALDNLCVTHPCLSVTQQGYITQSLLYPLMAFC